MVDAIVRFAHNLGGRYAIAAATAFGAEFALKKIKKLF